MKKKVFFLLVAILMAGYAHAQVRIGVSGGLNYANKLFYIPAASTSMGTQMKPGFQAGVVLENNIGQSDNVSSQVGLSFVSQECKFREGIIYGSADETLSMTYIRIPIRYLYKIDLSDMKLLLQGGVDLGLAVAGKIKHDNMEEKIKFSSDGISRFETIFGLGPGLQFGNFQAVLEYNIGYNSGSSNIMMFNNGFAFNLTYFFFNK